MRKGDDLGVPRLSIFNHRAEPEAKQIEHLGQDLVERVKFIKTCKTAENQGGTVDGDSDDGDEKQIVKLKDPKVEYFLHCKAEVDLCLPILDKVFNKTLYLCDYTLSKGHCIGLAAACVLFDNSLVNRVFFDNCGISDLELAKILEGLGYLRDIKSIIYKRNMFGHNAVEKLEPLLKRRIPFHL